MIDASKQKRKLLLNMFNAAVFAAQPHQQLTAFLPTFLNKGLSGDPQKSGRVVIIGAGKAAAAMAETAEIFYRKQFDFDRVSGVVIVPDGVSSNTQTKSGSSSTR